MLNTTCYIDILKFLHIRMSLLCIFYTGFFFSSGTVKSNALCVVFSPTFFAH